MALTIKALWKDLDQSKEPSARERQESHLQAAATKAIWQGRGAADVRSTAAPAHSSLAPAPLEKDARK